MNGAAKVKHCAIRSGNFPDTGSVGYGAEEYPNEELEQEAAGDKSVHNVSVGRNVRESRLSANAFNARDCQLRFQFVRVSLARHHGFINIKHDGDLD
jgi:hypothetical protein